MCGIVGAVGSKTAVEDVLEGLRRLEYRGYDSAGIAAIAGGKLERRRETGKIKNLEKLLQSEGFSSSSSIALGHTRWATHGEPSRENAHPHQSGAVAVVHNGIIENYVELREALQSEGETFTSQTDTETIPVHIQSLIKKGQTPLEAVVETAKISEGAFAFGVLFEDDGGKIIAARQNAPLVIGVGDGCHYLGSDALALAPFTNKVIFLENGDIAEITADTVTICTQSGVSVSRDICEVDVDKNTAEKGAYDSFMMKEIEEQPAAISATLSKYLSEDMANINLPEMPFDLSEVSQITMVACGTSWHAALVAKYWFEEHARVPVNVDVASEFRYRNPPLVKGGLTILLSQSGETADTLAALEYAKQAGQHILSLVNVPESSIDRASDVSLYTQAGAEIGVASTKAFTTQLALLGLLVLHMASKKALISEEKKKSLLEDLKKVPVLISQVLKSSSLLEGLAKEASAASTMLYLGRHALFPIALEGALKTKEISYIHAEAYSSGEMKHGPIALIEENVPIVVLAPSDALFEKSLSNLKEVEARRGRTFVFTDEKGKAVAGDFETRTIVTLPEVSPFIMPFIYSVPMQLFAYYIATALGRDVDQPRNLAKSVTVE